MKLKDFLACFMPCFPRKKKVVDNNFVNMSTNSSLNANGVYENPCFEEDSTDVGENPVSPVFSKKVVANNFVNISTNSSFNAYGVYENPCFEEESTDVGENPVSPVFSKKAVANNFVNMSTNPNSYANGVFYNPCFERESAKVCQNPFLADDEIFMLVKNGNSYIPVVDSNPFFMDCLENCSIINPYEDMFQYIPQSPVDSITKCNEWVEKHRKYHFKMTRRFSV